MGISYLLKQMSGPLGGDDASGTSPDPEALTSEKDESGLGPLLDEKNPKKVAAAVLKNWTSQDEGLSRVLAEIEQAEGWRNAERWVYLRKGDNGRQWEVWRPPGIDRLPSLPDKVDELCRRFASQLTVDAPKMEGVPATGEEADVQAAEMVTTIFEVDGGESGWNFRLLAEGAIDIATTQKSAFAHVWVNPVGGGERPVTVMAHPQATQYDDQNPEACTLDPMTGQPTADVVAKYLAKDGVTLDTAESANTLTRWVPKVDVKLLGARHVRFLPEWTRGITDADGVIVADYVSIGELKQRYPAVKEMDAEALKKLVHWKPFEDQILLPAFTRDPQKVGTWLNKGEVPDDAVALVLWEYHKQSPVYPKGAQVCISDDAVLGQGTLEMEVERPDGSKVPEVLEVPLAQCRCLNDWVGLSPYGQSLVTKMGPWNEMMAQQWVALQEFLDRLNNPFMFLPIGSAVQPDQLAQRDGRPILVNGREGQPMMEETPNLSTEIGRWYEFAVSGLNSASLLSETANATELPNVNSGVQANTIIWQVLVAVSSCQANATDFLTRTGRLILQRLRAVMTVPQTVKYEGNDGAYKADEWRGADLYGAKDVRLARGTFTGMRDDQKRQRIIEDVQLQVLPLEEAAELLADGTSEKVGLDEDPVRMRVKRQIEGFFDKGAPFEPLPVDDVPTIAQKRFRELAKQMMSTRFKEQDPQKQQAYVAEYDRCRQAAGITTLAEQAQQQQQQMEQQAQQAQMQEQAKVQGEIAKEQAKAQTEMQVEQAKAQLVMPPPPEPATAADPMAMVEQVIKAAQAMIPPQQVPPAAPPVRVNIGSGPKRTVLTKLGDGTYEAVTTTLDDGEP